MKQPISRMFGLLFKLILALIVIFVLLVAWYVVQLEAHKRPLGSPPPGFENRLKYKEGNPGPSNSNIVPVDIWFGKHNGNYDTTHLRINSAYLTERPHYHGEATKMMVVWPSMQSLQAFGEQQKQEGISVNKEKKQFTIILSEDRPTGSGDKNGTAPQFRCEPVIYDKARGVKYCNEIRNIDNSRERFTNYWPLDKSLKTPWYKNPPKARCNVIDRKKKWIAIGCLLNLLFV